MNTTEKIVAGILNMKKMLITYTDGTEVKKYTILPHLVGKIKSTGNVVLSAYEVSEIKHCWKTFLLANISDAELTEENFEHTSEGYNPKDKRMATIICAISSVR